MSIGQKRAVRTVLADDHTVLRVGLRAFLEDQTDPRINVVGEASSGEEAIRLVGETQPQLLLLDLSMPGLGGIETTMELRRKGTSPYILIVTQYAEVIYLQRALEAGANGYVIKTARGEELMTAIRAVIAGGTYIDPQLAGSLFQRRNLGGNGGGKDGGSLEKLTPRERQVLCLVAEGFSNKEIATALDVAVKTVMTHRANLMDKLDIHNQSKLVQFAIRVGLITGD